VLKGLYLPPGNEPSNHALTTPPPAAATTTRAATTTASLGSSTRAKSLPSPQVQAARSNTSAQVTQNIPIQNHASPAAAQMHIASPQAMQPPFPIQAAGLRWSPPAHSVAPIHAQGYYLDDASSFSATENGTRP